MAYRSSARWLAPLALLGAMAAILAVISSSDGSSSRDGGASALQSTTGSATTSATTTTTTTGSTTTGKARRYYVVKTGDVLSAIADATGVPLSRIEALNPSVDAQTLHAGQKIKLAP